MDPLSILASIAGVATAGTQLSNLLFKLISSVRHAHEDMKAVAMEMSILSSSLEQLHEALAAGKGIARQKFLIDVQRSVNNVRATQAKLEQLVEEESASILKRFKWLKSRALLEEIQKHKITITLQATVLSSAFLSSNTATQSEPSSASTRLKLQAENLVLAGQFALLRPTKKYSHPEVPSDGFLSLPTPRNALQLEHLETSIEAQTRAAEEYQRRTANTECRDSDDDSITDTGHVYHRGTLDGAYREEPGASTEQRQRPRRISNIRRGDGHQFSYKEKSSPSTGHELQQRSFRVADFGSKLRLQGDAATFLYMLVFQGGATSKSATDPPLSDPEDTQEDEVDSDINNDDNTRVSVQPHAAFRGKPKHRDLDLLRQPRVRKKFQPEFVVQQLLLEWTSDHSDAGEDDTISLPAEKQTKPDQPPIQEENQHPRSPKMAYVEDADESEADNAPRRQQTADSRDPFFEPITAPRGRSENNVDYKPIYDDGNSDYETKLPWPTLQPHPTNPNPRHAAPSPDDLTQQGIRDFFAQSRNNLHNSPKTPNFRSDPLDRDHAHYNQGQEVPTRSHVVNPTIPIPETTPNEKHDHAKSHLEISDDDLDPNVLVLPPALCGNPSSSWETPRLDVQISGMQIQLQREEYIPNPKEYVLRHGIIGKAIMGSLAGEKTMIQDVGSGIYSTLFMGHDLKIPYIRGNDFGETWFLNSEPVHAHFYHCSYRPQFHPPKDEDYAAKITEYLAVGQENVCAEALSQLGITVKGYDGGRVLLDPAVTWYELRNAIAFTFQLRGMSDFRKFRSTFQKSIATFSRTHGSKLISVTQDDVIDSPLDQDSVILSETLVDSYSESMTLTPLEGDPSSRHCFVQSGQQTDIGENEPETKAKIQHSGSNVFNFLVEDSKSQMLISSDLGGASLTPRDQNLTEKSTAMSGLVKQSDRQEIKTGKKIFSRISRWNSKRTENRV